MTYRTLILEDDENVRRLLAMYLRKRGHEVLSYDSPIRCPDLEWSACRGDQQRPCFDFLISDNMMPGMTGLEFLEMQERRGCQMDCRHKALITGYLQEHEKTLADKLNCHVFQKPIDWGDFCHWLEEGEIHCMDAAS